MKTRNALAITVTALLMGTTALFAGTEDDVIQKMKDEGYTRITIKRGVMRTKIEATSEDGSEREVVIRNATDTILKDEKSGPDGDDDDDDHEDDDNDDDHDDDD